MKLTGLEKERPTVTEPIYPGVCDGCNALRARVAFARPQGASDAVKELVIFCDRTETPTARTMSVQGLGPDGSVVIRFAATPVVCPAEQEALQQVA